MQCNGLQSLELYEQTVIVCQIPQWILQVPVRPSEGQMQRDWDRHLYQLPLNCVKANIWCHGLQHQWVIFSHQLATLLQYIVKKVWLFTSLLCSSLLLKRLHYCLLRDGKAKNGVILVVFLQITSARNALEMQQKNVLSSALKCHWVSSLTRKHLNCFAGWFKLA